MPEAAVILSGEQSGSMRYYTHRPILRWEAATPEALTSAIATLEAERPSRLRRPRCVGERAVPQQSSRRCLPPSLDWPPVLEAGTSHRTRLWKLSDRDRFLRGEPLNIIRTALNRLAGAFALGPIIISFRAHSGGLVNSLLGLSVAGTLAARLSSQETAPGGLALRYPVLLVAGDAASSRPLRSHSS